MAFGIIKLLVSWITLFLKKIPWCFHVVELLRVLWGEVHDNILKIFEVHVSHVLGDGLGCKRGETRCLTSWIVFCTLRAFHVNFCLDLDYLGGLEMAMALYLPRWTKRIVCIWQSHNLNIRRCQIWNMIKNSRFFFFFSKSNWDEVLYDILISKGIRIVLWRLASNITQES